MQENVFVIAKIFEKVVGYNPLTLPQDKALSLIPLGQKFTIPKTSEPVAQNVGSIFPVRAERKKFTAQGSPLWRDTNSYTGFMPVTIVAAGKEYQLGHTIVSISGKKKLVETDMTERNGSVIELIHTGNYEIALRGIALGQNGEFPDEEIAILKDLYISNEPIGFRCALTDIYLEADDSCVIKGFDIPAKAGVENVREYSLSIVSNPILTLEITD